MLYGIGLVVVVAVIVLVLRSKGKSPVALMEEEDGVDALKRWARGCYAMVYGKDPAKTGKRRCAGSLEEYWEITTPEQVRSTLIELQELPENDVAWDLMRAVIVARTAVGAELISNEECWATIGAIRPRIQQAFGGWIALADAYGKARTEAGYDADMLTSARPVVEQIWAVVPFK